MLNHNTSKANKGFFTFNVELGKQVRSAVRIKNTSRSDVAFKESGANFLIPSPITTSNELVTVWDPEVGKINPSEHKQLKLARSLTRGISDRDLKPSSSERKHHVMNPPYRKLSILQNFLTKNMAQLLKLNLLSSLFLFLPSFAS
ncbi:hypothetical protein TEA_024956 [Camellia sinensis var. sinensis]|uniref:MSP domain-containing protein n=1 Tax=Camellia sinensis var. sinensis TaxID=542762 RepID=A0A4S4DXM0_CAMSN|nr:hypothetical protein TEA_024956 [Camellia sinensis var. sinensis]